MSIKVGDKIPEAKLTQMTADGPAPISTSEIFKGKKVVLFAVPGAFTPTCSAKHLPGFVGKAAELKAKGVDAIACVSVNDVFVMNAWGKDQSADGKVLMLADGNAEFTSAMGLELDGIRLRHGQAQPALFPDRRGRRRDQAQYREAGGLRSVLCRDGARPALSRGNKCREKGPSGPFLFALSDACGNRPARDWRARRRVHCRRVRHGP